MNNPSTAPTDEQTVLYILQSLIQDI